MRMMMRILLPSIVEDEIATFDDTEGHDLLAQWSGHRGCHQLMRPYAILSQSPLGLLIRRAGSPPAVARVYLALELWSLV